MQTSNPYFFCFDITLDSKLNYYLPTAFVVIKGSYKGYLDKKAVPEVLESLGIKKANLDQNTSQLLAICEILKPSALFKKFASKSKAKNIEDLLQDKKIAFALKLFIELKLNLFLDIVEANNFPLSLNLDADKNFEKCKIYSEKSILEAKLSFVKHDIGINYTLSLQEQDRLFLPSDHFVVIILNDPAWLIVDKNLYRLKDINSNKLKPFLKNKSIEIPAQTVPKFFDTFIKDIVKKVKIETNGFNVA
ncbi:hypothetical protein RCH18_002980 [Flavobacterium sp. PL11]|uniref:hypothetical protein n=1 Tax=Flavobacterium sp. PL11 TaxID=3071717 RepID=UPI002DF74F21|nr:hypothetical protein [Flavobacterium sp. PL11]